MIALGDGDTTIELPEDLVWQDEFSWASVAQTVTRGLTGSLIIQAAVRTEGRPITLVPPESGGWMLRSAWSQIQTWLDTPGQQLTLTLRGTPYLVEFRHVDGGAEAVDVLHYADPTGAHHITPTFRFLTVSE